MVLFIVAGVPGVGKTTILQLVKKELHEARIINYGDLMVEIARKKFDITDRDDIRKKLTAGDYTELQKEAALKIKQIAETEKILFIDTHMSVKKPEGYYPGMPSDVVDLLRPAAIFLIEGRPEDILERRLRDSMIEKPEITEVGTLTTPRRGRDIEDERLIELQQRIDRYYAAAISEKTKIPIKIIDLRFPQKEEFEHAKLAAKEIIEVVRRFI